MGKSSRNKARQAATAAPGEVGPRQPCPCGSGRRYKACHGSPDGPPLLYVARPFAGHPAECDLIALRELVPAATAPLEVTGTDRTVTLATLLPGAAPAIVRGDGSVLLGLQVQHAYGDANRDLGAVLSRALEADEGVVGLPEAPGEGPRFTDLVAEAPLDITIHDGFNYWLDEDQADDPMLIEALEQANGAIDPAARLTGVEAAYWTNVGAKEHLRWVRPEPEDVLLAALSRVHVAGRDRLVDDGRLVGMFRTHGVLVPVWDLPVGTGAEALEEPAAAFGKALEEALADTSELTAEERRARSGLANRQVTIR